MTQLSLQIPISNLPNSTEDPKVAADLTAIQNVINGGLDYSNFAGGDGIHRFSYRLCTSNATAVSGDWIVAGPGVTITLPAPTKNLTVAVTAQGTVTSANPVTVAGTNIYGVGLSAAASFKLGAALAHVILQADNAGNWLIVSGQQDTGWVTLASLGALAANSSTPGHSTDAIQIRKTASIVRLQGGIGIIGAGYSSGATIATVPSGYRAPGNWKLLNGSYESGFAIPQSIGIIVGGTVGTGVNGPGVITPYQSVGLASGDTIWLDTSWTVD